MEHIKKYLKFFFQTERVHPMHVFALICFLITIVTLPFYLVSSIIEKNYFDLMLRIGMLVSLIALCTGGYQAYQKSKKTDSQEF